MMSWSRLVRFKDANGNEKLGDLVIEGEEDLDIDLKSKNLQAAELHGALFGPHTRGDTVEVTKLLPVLRRVDVPIIRCIGLNYMKHSTPVFSQSAR